MVFSNHRLQLLNLLPRPWIICRARLTLSRQLFSVSSTLSWWLKDNGMALSRQRTKMQRSIASRLLRFVASESRIKSSKRTRKGKAWSSLALYLTWPFIQPDHSSSLTLSHKGPSIYDVHMEGGGVRLRWTHVDGGGGPAPCGRPHRKLKLESTDVILSSSHAKKLASFYQNFVFGQIKSGNFSGI